MQRRECGIGRGRGRTFPAFPRLWYRYGTKETKKTHRSHLTTSKGSGINLSYTSQYLQYRNRNSLESTQTANDIGSPPLGPGRYPRGQGGWFRTPCMDPRPLFPKWGSLAAPLGEVCEFSVLEGLFSVVPFLPLPIRISGLFASKSQLQYYLVYAQSSWLFQKSY